MMLISVPSPTSPHSFPSLVQVLGSSELVRQSVIKLGLSLAVMHDAVAERNGGILHPIGKSFQAGAFSHPCLLMGGITAEILLLILDRFLFPVSPVQRIN